MNESGQGRPPHLLLAILVAGGLYLALNVIGIVFLVGGHTVGGLLLIVASVFVLTAVYLWTRRAREDPRADNK
jgi:hypothetical protein